MKSCDEFQLAMEMRRHGALSPAEAKKVEAHLATCAACSAIESQAAAVSELLGRPPEGDGPSLETVLEKAAKEERRENWLPLVALASFVVQGALLSWLISPESMWKIWGLFWLAGAGMAAVTVIALRVHRRRARSALTQGVEAWISHRRAHLSSGVSQMKVLRFVGPVLALISGIGAVHATGQGDPRSALLWGCCGLFLAGAVVMERFGAMLRRELKSLGERVET